MEQRVHLCRLATPCEGGRAFPKMPYRRPPFCWTSCDGVPRMDTRYPSLVPYGVLWFTSRYFDTSISEARGTTTRLMKKAAHHDKLIMFHAQCSRASFSFRLSPQLLINHVGTMYHHIRISVPYGRPRGKMLRISISGFTII